MWNTSVPEVAEPLRSSRPPPLTDRLLVFCDEDAEVRDPVAALAVVEVGDHSAVLRLDRPRRRFCRGGAGLALLKRPMVVPDCPWGLAFYARTQLRSLRLPWSRLF